MAGVAASGQRSIKPIIIKIRMKLITVTNTGGRLVEEFPHTRAQWSSSFAWVRGNRFEERTKKCLQAKWKSDTCFRFSSASAFLFVFPA